MTRYPRDVAIVAFARSGHRRTAGTSETEMLLPVLTEVLRQAGLRPGQADFTCSGSSDYLAGRPFSFTMTLDAVGAWPPITESHVEMDGAWALYEAWVKILTGEADTALVHAYGTPSAGDLRDVLTRQLDPYYTAPLWPDPASLAGLQARALLDAGGTDEAALAADHPDPYARPHGPVPDGDGPPTGDGAAAVVIAAGDTARRMCARPAWIRGIDHRIEAHALGVRDLTDSPSTRLAAERAGAFDAAADAAELHAPFPSQEVILRRALRLHDDVLVTPSAGAPAGNPLMAAGLIRLGEAAARIHRGEADRVLAHATSGPCLQQNLVAVLEGERSSVRARTGPDSRNPQEETR
ncbi:lipid-transfer protein [Streptomyces sp. ISL-11]|uniref:lipid-transfer protein n=1 Tax=Streptomyces sp. ISL-11 TaxID=2819174 RepID=UPI001BE8012C|nr:lipid-transfer protein [Streptomyces sp. ISL-11]MBT2385511.1 lipid-transfer protein [Streptomyces sp. ISL-11]